MSKPPEDESEGRLPAGWRVLEAEAPSEEAVPKRRFRPVKQRTRQTASRRRGPRPSDPSRRLTKRKRSSKRLRELRTKAPRLRQLERECNDFFRTATEEELMAKIREGLSELDLMWAQAMTIDPDG